MLFGIILWEEVVYELAVAAPLQLLVIFLLSRMLELQHVRVFWTCEISVIVAFCLLRMQLPSAALLAAGAGHRGRARAQVEEMLAAARGAGK